MIKCEDVCKSFGEKTALDHVSVNIPKGKIFGLLGPNGAGKTTLIRIINRITIPNSGTILFDGRPITQQDVQKIGYLPEERGLYRKMRVGDQAMYFARLKGMSARDAAAALKIWFEKFGIQSWWGKKVEELSKGMAQKVQFITTVVHKPSLLILDEPFSGFDPVNAQLIRNEILDLKAAGATIVLSTHNMESVEELCDNIALINKSHVVISGGVGDIRHKYGNNHIELVYTASAPIASVPGIFRVLSDNDESGRHTAVLAADETSDKSEVPIWILILGGAGIVAGLATLGYKIIASIGVNLVRVTPSRGFTIELGAAIVVLIGSRLGIPLSTTHCQVGSTVGVGVLEGKKGINWKLFMEVFAGWVLTLVVAALVAAGFFWFAVGTPTMLVPFK